MFWPNCGNQRSRCSKMFVEDTKRRRDPSQTGRRVKTWNIDASVSDPGRPLSCVFLLLHLRLQSCIIDHTRQPQMSRSNDGKENQRRGGRLQPFSNSVIRSQSWFFFVFFFFLDFKMSNCCTDKSGTHARDVGDHLCRKEKGKQLCVKWLLIGRRYS